MANKRIFCHDCKQTQQMMLDLNAPQCSCGSDFVEILEPAAQPQPDVPVQEQQQEQNRFVYQPG